MLKFDVGGGVNLPRHLCCNCARTGSILLWCISVAYVQDICQCMWCNGFPEHLCSIGAGVGSICHMYMCIVIYMKHDLV